MFVLKDFDKHLENVVILRLFKDLINLIKNTKNTVVLVAPEYKLPKDIEPDAGHIVGGYPDEREIASLVKETCSELARYDKRIKTSLTVEEIQKAILSLKGLSVQQIRNILNQCLVDDGVLDVKDLKRIESYKRKLFDQEGLLEFCGTESKDNIANFDNLKRWLEERRSSFIQKTSSIPVPEGRPSHGGAGVRQKPRGEGDCQRTRVCLFTVWMSAGFTASTSARPSRTCEGPWASSTSCLPCVCGLMR